MYIKSWKTSKPDKEQDVENILDYADDLKFAHETPILLSLKSNRRGEACLLMSFLPDRA